MRAAEPRALVAALSLLVLQVPAPTISGDLAQNISFTGFSDL